MYGVHTRNTKTQHKEREGESAYWSIALSKTGTEPVGQDTEGSGEEESTRFGSIA